MSHARGVVAFTFCIALLSASAVPLGAADVEGERGELDDDDRVLSESVVAPLAARSLLLDGARAGQRVVAVGERGHVLLSDDEGASWRQVVVPSVATLTAVAFADERNGWAVGHDALILHTQDGGETWKIQYEDIERESPLLDLLVLDGRRAIAVGAYGLYLETQDGGAHWQERSIVERDAHYNAIFAGDGQSLYIVGEFGTVLRSPDGGARWETLPSPYGASFFGGFALPSGDLIVVGLRGHAYRYVARSEEWRELATGMQSSLMTGTALPDGRVLLVGADGALLRGTPNGTSNGDDMPNNNGMLNNNGMPKETGLALHRRPDRETISSLVPAASGRWILFGTFGADVVEESTLP